MSKKTLLHYAAPAIITGMLFATVAVSWDEPGSNPPAGNVAAPINVSVDNQSKEGWLTIGSTLAPSMQLDVQGIAPALGSLNVTGGAILNTGGAATGLIVANGNVGVGTTNPLRTLDITGSTRVKGAASSNITGTADPTASAALVGLGTKFTTELVVGDRITILGETRTVTAITDDTHLTVGRDFTDTLGPAPIIKIPAIFIAKDSSDNVSFIVRDGHGKVGIGTAYPQKTLHVAGDGEIILEDSSVGIHFLDTTNDDFSIFANLDRLEFRTATTLADLHLDASIKMVMDTSGNVGIGTIDPQAQLHLEGNAGSNAEILLKHTGPANVSSAGIEFNVANDPNRFYIKAHDNRLKFITNNGDAMTIMPDTVIPTHNNIGIGTTDPQKPLHVQLLPDALTPHQCFNGSVLFEADELIVRDSSAEFKLESTKWGGNDHLNWQLAGGVSGGADGVLHISSYPDVGGETTRLKIDGNNGNVGIGLGVNNPSERLEVNGTIKGTDYRSGDGSLGLTQDVVVKGSTGLDCTLTFKDGLLTATSCP